MSRIVVSYTLESDKRKLTIVRKHSEIGLNSLAIQDGREDDVVDPQTLMMIVLEKFPDIPNILGWFVPSKSNNHSNNKNQITRYPSISIETYRIVQ